MVESVLPLTRLVTSVKGTSLDEVRSLQRAYFTSGATRSFEFRSLQLRKLLQTVKKRHKDIAYCLKQDLGKSPCESILAETSRVCEEITYALKHLRSWMNPKRASTPFSLQPASSHVRIEPLGQVLIISPWNYPFQLALAPVIGALAAGNTIVLKPSELAPHTSELVAQIIGDIFDERLVAVFCGDARISNELLELPWDHVFFTGSTEVGRIVAQKAAKHLCPVTLELGGKSPCIVDESAKLDVAAKRIAWSKLFNNGQTCVAPDYVMVKDSIKDQFIDHLKSAIIKLYGTDTDHSADYGRIINQRHFERLVKLLEDQKIVFGGDYNPETRFFAPTIIDEPVLTSPVMEQEIFGPILPIISYRVIDDVIRQINSRPKPLALYMYSQDRSRCEQVFEQIPFGGGMINDGLVHVGNCHIPFGGVGASGMGAYHGRYSFEAFSHRKAVMTASTAMDLPLRYPPYTIMKERIFRRIFGF